MVGAIETNALQTTLAKLHGFLNQLDSIPASPVEATVAEWKSRLDKVTTKLGLATIILELESDVNDLGSGLPSGEIAAKAVYSMGRKTVQSSALAHADLDNDNLFAIVDQQCSNKWLS